MTIPLTDQLRVAADDEVRAMPGWAVSLLRAAAANIEQLEIEAAMLRVRIANDGSRISEARIAASQASASNERMLALAQENGERANKYLNLLREMQFRDDVGPQAKDEIKALIS